jgi:hypothetical protein
MHKITCQLKFDREKGILYFKPSNFADNLLIEKKFKEDDFFNVKITKGRTLKKLGEYWLIMSAFTYYRSEGSPELWHRLFKQEYFGYKEVLNPFTGENEKQVESTAFDKMDELQFVEYLTWIKDKLLEFGIDSYDMISNYKNHGGE